MANRINKEHYFGVTAEEVVNMLKDVASEKLVPKVIGPVAFGPDVSGNIRYKVGDWTVVVFADCGGFDYVDSVVSPDGRKGRIQHWFDMEDDRHPSLMLYNQDAWQYQLMAEAFMLADFE